MTDFWSDVDPANDVSAPFNARYAGTCTLATCERRGVIEKVHVCKFVDGSLVQMACSRRIAR